MNVQSSNPLIESESPGLQDGPGRPWVADMAEELDVRRLLNMFFRRLKLFIATVVGVIVAVALFTFLSTPKYTGEADVMLSTQTTTVTNITSVLSGLAADSSVADSE